jgi:4-azaleucine resistance transporter AzlC
VSAEGPRPNLTSARRQLLFDSVGIAVSAIGFGFVFGLAARNAGYSPIEATAMSVFAFAGAAQFAAVGYVAQGLPWLPIVVLTFFLNARHLLYSASLAPRLRRVPFLERAAMAHFLTDEAFALAATHFHRVGRADVAGYWIGAVVAVFIPWNLATLAGVLLGGVIPDPSRFGLDIVFPAAMAGSRGLVTGRREIVAAGSGAAIGVGLSLVLGPAVGIVAGGLIGPAVAMTVPMEPRPVRVHAESPVPLRPSDMDDAFDELDDLAGTGVPPANPEPPMPFGRFDIEQALENAASDATIGDEPDRGGA